MNIKSLLLATLVVILAACSIQAQPASQPQSESLDKVVFMAGFKPQANLPFVAAYVAQEKGYFKEQGLDVEIRHASSGEHLQLLMAGSVDITTADAGSVLKRRSDPGLPIVAFALFGQRGQQGIVALKDSGISTPKDWEGKIFGYKTSQPPEYLAILKAEDVDRSQIQEVRVGFDPRVLTEGQVDLLAVFKSNEPDTIRELGFDVNLWDPADYGVPTLGLTYITRQELTNQEPEKVARFLKATLRGLQFAIDNREEAIDIVLRYAPSEDREHQRFMLDTEIQDAISPLTGENGLGWMTDVQWKALYDHLIEFNALPQTFDYQTAYTDEFLKQVYEGDELIWP
jgi:ABC-type nitrate/sulfonate/bicarbonate transport system substrate-binding protein